MENGSATISAPASITLRGDLGFAAERGIDIGDDVTASFTGGGLIQNFPGAGIVMGATKGSVLQGLVINSNGKDGVQVTGAKDLLITGNNISGNGSDGIHLEDSTDAEITDVQGQQLIYTTTTDAEPKSFTFTIPVSSSVVSGGFITATATPTTKPTNTSEFSNVGTVQAAPNPL